MASQDRLSQGLAIFLMLYVHLSTVFAVALPWYLQYAEDGSPQAPLVLVSLVLLNLMIMLIYWNYYLCCSTDPGAVPKDYYPEVELPMPALGDSVELDDDGERTCLTSPYIEPSRLPLPPSASASVLSASSSIVIEKKRSGDGHRFCKKCNVFKPPRSHHCSACKRCILKMDHHCPWIANCVGFFNHGHYIRFLLSTSITSSFYLIFCILRFSTYLARFNPIFSPHSSSWDVVQLAVTILNTILCTLVLVSVSVISAQHLLYLCRNTTLIEALEIANINELVRKMKQSRDPNVVALMSKAAFPFDLGIRHNFRAILGPYIWNACWPRNMEGDGIHFPISSHIPPGSIVEWPPSLDMHGGKKDTRDMRGDYESQFSFSRGVRRDSEGYIVPSSLHLK